MKSEIDPLLCSVAQATRILGIGRSKCYEMIGSGQLCTVVIGRRRLVRLDSVRALALGEAA